MDRKQPHHHALAGKSARRKGSWGSWHDRLLAGRSQLGCGRAKSSGCAASRHAADAGKNLEDRLYGRSSMIPQHFDYATPASMQEALALLSDGDAKVLAGGM